MFLSGELEQTYLGSLVFKSKHRAFCAHPGAVSDGSDHTVLWMLWVTVSHALGYTP